MPKNGLVVYSDAAGQVAAVAGLPDGSVYYTAAVAPSSLRRKLQHQKTQITAFELWAALVAVLTFVLPHQGRSSVLFVDNKAALGCLVKGYSKHADLNALVGGLLAKCASTASGVVYEYVQSKLNLADGPSRNSFQHLSALRIVKVSPVLLSWSADIESWAL